MAAPATIRIDVTANTKQASQGLKETASNTKTFGSQFKSVFAGVLGSNIVTSAASKIWAFGKQSVEAYENAQKNAALYSDAMKRIPGASDQVTRSLQAQAKALSRVTVYSAGQVKQGQATLAQFKLTGAQLKQATPLLLDYAAKTGKALPDAATDMGKALLGQGRAFKAIGLNLKDTGSQAGNFAQLMTQLQGKVGGVAQAMGETGAGKAAIMRNQINALKVTVGEQLAPALEKVVAVGTRFTTWIAQNSGTLMPVAGFILAIVAAVKAWSIVQAILNAELWSSPIGLIVVAIVAVGAALIIAYQKVGWFRAAVQAMGAAALAAFNFVKNAAMATFRWIASNWPLLIAILAGPFGVVALLIIRNWGTITGAFRSAFQTISGIVTGIIGWFARLPGAIAGAVSGVYNAITRPFIDAFNAVRDAVNAVVSWVGDQFGRIKSIASDALGVIRAIYNPFANAWNAVHLSFSVPKWVPGVGGKGFDFRLPQLPTLAAGGVVSAATLALIGEGRGREIVAPEALLRSIVHSESGGATVNVFVPAVANPAETGRAVANVLRAYFQAGGRLTVPA